MSMVTVSVLHGRQITLLSTYLSRSLIIITTLPTSKLLSLLLRKANQNKECATARSHLYTSIQHNPTVQDDVIIKVPPFHLGHRPITLGCFLVSSSATYRQSEPSNGRGGVGRDQ
jgi:hypothetical protein